MDGTDDIPPISGSMGDDWGQLVAAGTSLVNFSADYFGLKTPEELSHSGMDSSSFEPMAGDSLWFQQNAPNAELLDAAGGITLQNYRNAW